MLNLILQSSVCNQVELMITIPINIMFLSTNLLCHHKAVMNINLEYYAMISKETSWILTRTIL